MKKFWIINLLTTTVILIIVLTINSHFYKTIWDLGAAIVSLILFGIQFIICGVYLFTHTRQHTFLYSLLGAGCMGFIILSGLLIFNGIIWDTDTGWFRGLHE